MVRECRVYQQEIQFINHMREIREKSCLAKGKLQAGNMYTNDTFRLSGNIQENFLLETGTTAE